MAESTRAAHALALERLQWSKVMQEINEQSRKAEDEVVRDCSARGLMNSGIFERKIADVHRDRAKRIVDKTIGLRRESLQIAPELATEEEFRKLWESASSTIDRVLASIPEHLKRHGLRTSSSATSKRDEMGGSSLKSHAEREIKILRTQHSLSMTQKEVSVAQNDAKGKKKVWVVHGRNVKARDAMFGFLRAIGLEPMEWSEALALTGKGSPYTGEVLDRAFEQAQAVVVLITGDEMARLGTRYAELNDSSEETEPTPQARPNVLFEAGMAFGKYPDRTILVHLGRTRPFSDVVGRNVLHMSNDSNKRQGLVVRLRTAGCNVETDYRTDWYTVGDFDLANESPDLTPSSDVAAADIAAFKEIAADLKKRQANTYTPAIGSPDYEQAERLVERGLFKHGPMGGYVVARLF